MKQNVIITIFAASGVTYKQSVCEFSPVDLNHFTITSHLGTSPSLHSPLSFSTIEKSPLDFKIRFFPLIPPIAFPWKLLTTPSLRTSGLVNHRIPCLMVHVKSGTLLCPQRLFLGRKATQETGTSLSSQMLALVCSLVLVHL